MRFGRNATAFARDERGVAAVEMSLLIGMISMALLNVAEVGRYLYSSAAVGAQTQAGAQAAASRCGLEMTPATINCAALNGAVTTAIRGGTLGSDITLDGAIVEAWYCVNAATGALQNVGAVNARPANCLAAGNAAVQPHLYLRVNTRFTYQPMFPGVTIVERFPTRIVRSAWMRMD